MKSQRYICYKKDVLEECIKKEEWGSLQQINQ